jgi:transposase
LKVIREKCSEALHILDRFHIVAKMNKVLDEARGEETRGMKREGRDPVLKKSRWLLLKRSENNSTSARAISALQPENRPRSSCPGDLSAALGLQLARPNGADRLSVPVSSP